MNYDEYGFPIFDDDYVSDIKLVKKEEKKETVNIKKEDKEEPKKDKYALF